MGGLQSQRTANAWKGWVAPPLPGVGGDGDPQGDVDGLDGAGVEVVQRRDQRRPLLRQQRLVHLRDEPVVRPGPHEGAKGRGGNVATAR